MGVGACDPTNYEPPTGAFFLWVSVYTGASPCARLYCPDGALGRMHKMMKKCRFLCEKVEFYEKCCNFDATK